MCIYWLRQFKTKKINFKLRCLNAVTVFRKFFNFGFITYAKVDTATIVQSKPFCLQKQNKRDNLFTAVLLETDLLQNLFVMHRHHHYYYDYHAFIVAFSVIHQKKILNEGSEQSQRKKSSSIIISGQWGTARPANTQTNLKENKDNEAEREMRKQANSISVVDFWIGWLQLSANQKFSNYCPVEGRHKRGWMRVSETKGERVWWASEQAKKTCRQS